MANQNITLNGVGMKVRDNGDTSYSTTTSRAVVSQQPFINSAILDTANHDSSLCDISTYENTSIFVSNTLNQAVTVSVIVYDPNGTVAYVLPTTKSVPASSTLFITNTDIPQLVAPFVKMKIRLACTVAPASGNVNAWVMGQ